MLENDPRQFLAFCPDFEQGCEGYPSNYQEEWGLINAIDKNLASLSEVAVKIRKRGEICYIL